MDYKSNVKRRTDTFASVLLLAGMVQALMNHMQGDFFTFIRLLSLIMISRRRDGQASLLLL
ncbi:MAG: hypothetical protein JW931_06930 [Methanomicrobiaceae archaeon]|nr:hypothetical protein [Methanomicrobiaceae archaeon]